MSDTGPGSLQRINGTYTTIRRYPRKYISYEGDWGFGSEVTIKFIHDRSSIYRCALVQEWFDEIPEVELVMPELPRMKQF